MSSVDFGIIGGSGLYDLAGIADGRDVVMETPFGTPSAPYRVGTLSGRTVAFLPRLVWRLRQRPMLEVEELKARLETDEGLLLDVRTPADFNGEQGHIRGALNLPLEDLPGRLHKLGDDPERPIAIVCPPTGARPRPPSCWPATASPTCTWWRRHDRLERGRLAAG